MNMRSIAFPAVGTGFHKYPPDIVAREMFSQTMAFSTSYLTKIEFVVFHDNTDVIKVKLHINWQNTLLQFYIKIIQNQINSNLGYNVIKFG